MRTLLFTLPVLGTLVFTAPAKAEHPADAAAAQALFERGRSAAQQSDWQAACDAFAESERLDPGAGTLMNWATCEAHQNKVASAWGHFNDAGALLAAGDDRMPFVRAQLRGLARRLPRLTVRLSRSTPKAARVLRDGTELGAASLGLPLPVDPGAVELNVSSRSVATSSVRLPNNYELLCAKLHVPDVATTFPLPFVPSGESMARVTVEDCLEKEENRFALVVLAAARARSLMKGNPSLVNAKNKPLVISLREIAAGKVRFNRPTNDAVLEYITELGRANY